MPLTATEQEARLNRIGASEVPIIVMGPRFPWAKDYNARSLFLAKTGRMPGQPESQAMKLGGDLEPSLLQYASRELGPITRAQKQAIHSNQVMIATLDARMRDQPFLVELKVTGLVNRFYPVDRWGDWETPITQASDCDGVIPEEFYWQVTAQLACINSRVRRIAAEKGLTDLESRLYRGCYLIALLPGTSKVIRHYTILRNDSDVAFVEDVVCDWWDRHMVTDQEPSTQITPEAAKSLYRTDDGWVTVPDELFAAVKAAKVIEQSASQAYNEAKKAREVVEAQLLGAMGKHTKANSPGGHTIELVTKTISAKPYSRVSKNYNFAN